MSQAAYVANRDAYPPNRKAIIIMCAVALLILSVALVLAPRL